MYPNLRIFQVNRFINKAESLKINRIIHILLLNNEMQMKKIYGKSYKQNMNITNREMITRMQLHN